MKIIKKIAFATEEETSSSSLYPSNRSTGVGVDTGTLCITETAFISFYIFTSSYPSVVNGDIAYNTNNLTSPFNGGNQYYKVSFVLSPDYEAIVQIDSSGVMTLQETCPI